jgi:hypothetical protein
MEVVAGLGEAPETGNNNFSSDSWVIKWPAGTSSARAIRLIQGVQTGIMHLLQHSEMFHTRCDSLRDRLLNPRHNCSSFALILLPLYKLLLLSPRLRLVS